MNEIYTRLAEMLKKEENITIGTAYIKSTSPLVLRKFPQFHQVQSVL